MAELTVGLYCKRYGSRLSSNGSLFNSFVNRWSGVQISHPAPPSRPRTQATVASTGRSAASFNHSREHFGEAFELGRIDPSAPMRGFENLLFRTVSSIPKRHFNLFQVAAR